MRSIKIVYLPKGKWLLEVDGERSKPHPYERPISFRGYVAISAYCEEGVCQISRSLPMAEIELVDETV